MADWICVDLYNPFSGGETYEAFVNIDVLEAISKDEKGCNLCIGGFWHSCTTKYDDMIRMIRND